MQTLISSLYKTKLKAKIKNYYGLYITVWEKSLNRLFATQLYFFCKYVLTVLNYNSIHIENCITKTHFVFIHT